MQLKIAAILVTVLHVNREFWKSLQPLAAVNLDGNAGRPWTFRESYVYNPATTLHRHSRWQTRLAYAVDIKTDSETNYLVI